MKIWKRKTPGWLSVAISICIVIAGVAFLVITLRRRAAASECLENIELINGGKYEWALQSGSAPDAKPTWDDIYSYTGGFYGDGKIYPFRCPSGGTYAIGRIGYPAICSVHGFSIGVYERFSEYDANAITGAVVETLWSDGHKVKTRADDRGGVLVKAPSNQTATVIVSKPGFITVTTSIQSLLTDSSVTLQRARK